MIHKADVPYTPQEVGYDHRVIDRLDEHFQDCMKNQLIQGAAYLMARGGKIFVNHSMGKHSAIDDKGDLLPDSLRPIASVTKVFTTTAILQLIERGKIFLNEPVCHFIKEFDTTMHRKITIFHLLTHTSGLKASPSLYFEPYPEPDTENMTRENWIKTLLTGPLRFKPGSQWSYCSTGFELLAEVVAVVSGMDFDDYVIETIINPLGMEDTCFFPPEEKKHRIALTQSKWNLEFLNETKEDLPSPSLLGGGGLLSTVGDLFKMGQMMLNGGTFNNNRILGRKTVEVAIYPHIKDITSYCWQPNLFEDSILWTCGLGWELNKHNFLPQGVFDHEGADGAGLYVDPKEEFIFVGFYPHHEYSTQAWVNSLAVAWSGIL